jgi:hypothetical protein
MSFDAYLYDPANLAANPQGPFKTKCANRNDGQDPYTREGVSYMEWPTYQAGPRQRGAHVGWIIGSSNNCNPVACPFGQYLDQFTKVCTRCYTDRECKADEFVR